MAAIVDHISIMNEIDRLAVLSNVLHRTVAYGVIDSLKLELYFNKCPYDGKKIKEKALRSRLDDIMIKDPVDGTAIIVSNSSGIKIQDLVEGHSKFFDLKQLDEYINDILKAFEWGQSGIDNLYSESNEGYKERLSETSYSNLKKIRLFYDTNNK